MMTAYEIFRWVTFPIMPPLLRLVRSDLKSLGKSIQTDRLDVLDVGGRKSPYTIGLPCLVVISERPKESDVQKKLNLGLTQAESAAICRIRSNVKEVVYDDMTETNIESNSFYAVICVEVIEHVIEDEAFVKNIYSVIRPGGWAYFTTPNGDFNKNEGPNRNPDHIRHYTKAQLEVLLKSHFDRVHVKYAIKKSKFRAWGLPGYTLKKPLQTIRAIIGNLINQRESKGLDNQREHTAHLVAICHK